MKKIKMIVSAIALVSGFAIMGCSNPVNQFITQMPDDIVVEPDKSNPTAKLAVDQIFNQLGVFTDFEGQKLGTSLIETRLDGRYIKAGAEASDMSLTYPNATYYAKFDTENSKLLVKRGKFGEGTLETYYYCVLSPLDSNQPAYKAPYEIYISKEKGGEAVAKITNITGSGVITFDGLGIGFEAGTVDVYAFYQYKNQEVANDIFDCEAGLLTVEEFLKKYPETDPNDYGYVVDETPLLDTMNFPSTYTQGVWNKKVQYEREFNAKVSSLKPIIKSLHYCCEYTTYSQKYMAEGISITLDAGSDAIILEIDPEKYGNPDSLTLNLRFNAPRSFELMYTNADWWYEVEGNKFKASLTNKGVNSGNYAPFKEGDSVSIEIVKSKYSSEEKLPAAIKISANLKADENMEAITIPTIELKRENDVLTSKEISKIFEKYNKWEIIPVAPGEGEEFTYPIPEGIIEYITEKPQDYPWNVDEVESSYYIASVKDKTNPSLDYKRKKNLFSDFYNDSNPVVLCGTIFLGTLQNPDGVDASTIPSLSNLDGYSVKEVTYNPKTEEITFIADEYNEGKPTSVVFKPIK